jgi:hypothetical protein
MKTSIERCEVGAVVLTSLLVAACTSDGTTRSDFKFSVLAVRTGPTVTNIDVDPDPVGSPGQYKGGHARIEAKYTSPDSTIIWSSREPFWIEFEGLKSKEGNGAGTLCDKAAQEPSTWARSSGSGPYTWTCDVKKGRGKTISVKYHLTFTDPVTDPNAFKLDPVIIIDR